MAIYIEKLTKTRFDHHFRPVIEKAVKAVMVYKNIPDELDVNVMIVDPEEIRRINKETREIDSVTDVLSFPYFEYETPGFFDQELIEWADGDILGDIVICAEKIIRQAEEYGHSQKRELAFLTVHSMLHLVGYDHMSEQDAEMMEEEQKKIMEILNIPR